MNRRFRAARQFGQRGAVGKIASNPVDMQPLGLCAPGQGPYRVAGGKRRIEHRLADETRRPGQGDDRPIDTVHFITIWSRCTTEERGA